MKEGQVLKLQKALYGLKQAGRRWYKTLETILKTKGLQRSEYDQADRKSTRLNSSHSGESRMPSSA